MPAIAQDVKTGKLLSMARMNPESLALTATEKKAVYWSHSRQRLWCKGESTGNTQVVHEIKLDGDGDKALLEVEQQGGIDCHTGRENCFYRTLSKDNWRVNEDALYDPKDMYL